MSYGGDGYDDERGRGVPSQTRTRLPEQDGFTDRRPAASPGRSVVTIVGIVLILIAAIVFANRADDSSGGGNNGGSGDDGRPGANPTAPSGEQPVDGFTNGIPSGYPQTAQGAESAAANYAVALGGEGMFQQASRREIVEAVYTPEFTAREADNIDRVYSDSAFLSRIGLNDSGAAPEGSTFVARVVPVGTRIIDFTPDRATVAVWYSSLFGIAGAYSVNPVTESWYTNTYDLTWVDGDWKIAAFDQEDGPVPVARDQRASTAEEMAEAVEQYGGFTYAR
ncbi:hypothetical protein N0X72_12640 [Streptomyces carpaticus]|uniref:hypothetical protein n=1 Tax=Streptomyces carpaticus TaxID=285558 RepID=UPI00220BE1AD|nr:hypothetical protein N0X72_12640 [Streptomyces carpaticus]